MGSRASLALSIALVAGCGAGGTQLGDLGPPSDMGSPSDAAMCTVVVHATPRQTVAPATLEAVGSGSVHGGAPDWIVTRAGSATPLAFTRLDPSGLRIQVDATLPGAYTFQLVAGACRGVDSVVVASPTGATISYRLRVSPPDSAGVPSQDRLISVIGGTPLAGVQLSLAAGLQWSGQLRGPDGPIAGHLRLLASTGNDGAATAIADGQVHAALNPDLDYQPLVIPASGALAPALLTSSTGSALPAVLLISAGATVTGHVLGPGPAPLPQARVVLRKGTLPTGVGVADASGSFSLAATPLTGDQLEVGATDWPTLSLAGVDVPIGGQSIEINYTAVQRTSSWVVQTSGGQPAVGARVSVRSAALPAASVTVGTAAAQIVSGRVERFAVAGPLGALPPLELPDVDLDVVIEPPGTTDGVTALHLVAGGPASRTLSLAARRTLVGHIASGGGGPVAGVRVVAVDTTGLGPAPEGTTDASGDYSLLVDAVDVELHLLPPASALLADRRLLVAATQSRADVTLDPGLLIQGQLFGPGGAVISGALIEVLCATCGDATPLTRAETGATGDFVLYVPDPGDLPDGGL